MIPVFRRITTHILYAPTRTLVTAQFSRQPLLVSKGSTCNNTYYQPGFKILLKQSKTCYAGFQTSNDYQESESLLDTPEFSNTEYEQSIFVKSKRRRNKKTVNIPVGENVLKVLEDQLEISHNEAMKIVSSSKFFFIADTAIIETIYTLKRYEISSQQVIRAPWLLLQSSGDLTRKIGILAEPFLFNNYHEGIGFCHFPIGKIKSYQKFFENEQNLFPEYKNRLYYLADKLSIPINLFTENVKKVPRILILNVERLNIYINLLNKYSIHREDILSDLWVFFHDFILSEERLIQIKEAGCQRPKLWMCRCPEEIFQKTLQKYKGQREALGDFKSTQELLMERLGCQQEELEMMLKYNTALKRIKAPKLKSMLDLLLDAGFEPEHIRQNLRVLRYSESRAASRIEQLRQLGFKTISFNLLLKSEQKFDKYCKAFEKGKQHNL